MIELFSSETITLDIPSKTAAPSVAVLTQPPHFKFSISNYYSSIYFSRGWMYSSALADSSSLTFNSSYLNLSAKSNLSFYN